jgi:ribonuclease HII
MRHSYAEEKERCELLSCLENEAYREGYRVVAGVDEAGRGPLAGPVVAAAVVLPRGSVIPEINDSKRLSALQRERVYWRILEIADGISIAMAPPAVIDQINILQATWKAMREAIARLQSPDLFALVDGWPVPNLPNHKGVVGGDSKSISIAAASIIAKVTRDRIMRELDPLWPQYGFAKHKGYPTPEHLNAIRCHGICIAHRRSFGPVAQAVLPLQDEHDE